MVSFELICVNKSMGAAHKMEYDDCHMKLFTDTLRPVSLVCLLKRYKHLFKVVWESTLLTKNKWNDI